MDFFAKNVATVASVTDESDAEESAKVFQALGELALAASQAEGYAAQGLYYLLTDSPGDAEGAARIASEFRSFDKLYRLLGVALRCNAPLLQIIDAAKSDSGARNAHGEPRLVSVMAEVAAKVASASYVLSFTAHKREATAEDYLNKVKALYDKRNECLHALGIEVIGGDAHLYKRKKDGAKTAVSAQSLLEPCHMLRYYRGQSLASAIQAVSIELAMAALPLMLLPVTVQWYRRRGTPLDLAPVVDHYMDLALAPLDEQIRSLSEIESALQAKIDAYHASKVAPPADERAELDPV